MHRSRGNLTAVCPDCIDKLHISLASALFRRSSSSSVDFSSAASVTSEDAEDISGKRKDQELTDSVMLEMEPRPSLTPRHAAAASATPSDDDEMETAERGRPANKNPSPSINQSINGSINGSINQSVIY